MALKVEMVNDPRSNALMLSNPRAIWFYEHPSHQRRRR